MTLLLILLLLAALVLGVSYVCFRIAFYSPARKPRPEGYVDVPTGPGYDELHDKMVQWVLDMRALPQEPVSITSFDGLTLTGRFFEFAPGAPMEIMFHGYRGNAERDLSGGVERAFRLGRSVLLVDQRASRTSGGRVISFGINEHRDCLKWIDFAISHYGPDVRIILTGISMGAATVMMAAGRDLPENVMGILADCGYSSPREIIELSIEQMGIPKKLGWPFVKLGARVFGRFDPEECAPVEALKKAKVPVIFYHGDADDLVPCSMSRDCYRACASRKELVVVPGAGHGLSYAIDPERYIRTLGAFFGPEGSHPSILEKKSTL